MSREVRIRPLEEGGDGDAAWIAIRDRLGYATPDTPPTPGAKRLLAWRGDEPLARGAIGVSEGLVDAPGRSGWVGWYEAADAEAGAALLRHARSALAQRGARRVLGPFNGSSWDRYRLALREPGPDETAPFLSEPWNPPDYPAHFTAAGYGVAAEYESRIAPPEEGDLARARQVRQELEARGVTARPLDLDRFDTELRAIHHISLAAFAKNRFYSPIGWERFREMYAPLRPLLDPELVFMAESGEGKLLGFSFSFRDPLAPRASGRVIAKTLATAPAARGSGLAGALISLTHGAATERGAGMVHALMEAGNLSRRISLGHRGERFRRYVLYTAPIR